MSKDLQPVIENDMRRIKNRIVKEDMLTFFIIEMPPLSAAV